MRRFILVAALGVALALPMLNPAPVSAGNTTGPGVCPAGYPYLVSLAEIQTFEGRFGKVRQASHQDVNHNGFVCLRPTGNGENGGGLTFADDIPFPN